MSEEDQMMRAIAMSLGQEVSMEQRSDSPEVCHFNCLKLMGKKISVASNTYLFFRKRHAGERRRTGEQGNVQRKKRHAVWSASWKQSLWTHRSFTPSPTPCFLVASIFWMSCLTQFTDSVTS